MKTQTKIFALGLLMAMTFTAYSQSPSETVKSGQSDQLVFIVASTDTPDGGSLEGGVSYENGTSDYKVIRRDASGQTLWAQTYGGNREDELTAIKATTDGGFVLGGRSNSSISGNKSDYTKGEYDIWVLKIDQDGEVEWDRTYGGAERDNLVAIEEMPDGVVVLAGYSDSRSMVFQDEESDFLVIWVDPAGNSLCEFRYGTKGKDILTSTTLLNDRGIILGGYARVSDSQFDYNLVKIDQFGATVWEKNLGSASDEFLSGLGGLGKEMDGGFTLYGESPVSSWVMKFDKDGNKVWMDPAVNSMFAEVEE